jgi:hypothetical protein
VTIALPDILGGELGADRCSSRRRKADTKAGRLPRVPVSWTKTAVVYHHDTITMCTVVTP